MSLKINDCEETIFSLMKVYEECEPVLVDETIDLVDLAKELFSSGVLNCKLFDNKSYLGGLFKFHLVLHRSPHAETNPTVYDMEKFGISKGYQSTNVRDLLFFYKACRERNDRKVIELLKSKEVVATDSNVHFGSGAYHVGAMIKGMSDFNIHAFNGNCPRFILVLMKEEIK